MVDRGVLLVGFEDTARRAAVEALSSFPGAVSTAADGGRALHLTARDRYGALLIAHPLPDRTTGAVLATLRAPRSCSRRAAVVLVAANGGRQEAESLVGRGANRVYDATEGWDRLPEVVAGLLRVKPRLDIRLPARLEVRLGPVPRRLFVETANLSESGALLAVPHSYPCGTEARIEIFLPDHRHLPALVGRVVRHTRGGQHPYPGIAVAFDRTDERYAEWLNGRLAAVPAA